MGLTDTKIAFVFPGQGAQYVGMGRDIYENFKEVRRFFDKADDLLKINLTRLCFEGPVEELKQTSICQPAILVVSLATLHALENICPEVSASVTAGLSLGEYSALVAAGVISFEGAVKLVHRRGEFMEETARTNPGKMASILGLEYNAVEKICKESGAEIANLNCPGQIVISGSSEAVERTVGSAKEKGARRAVYLEVSGPFHSSLMDPASKKLMFELNRIEITSPRIPVVSNVTAYFENTPEEIRTNLVNQINHATRWEDSIRLIIDAGITTFLEIGPGKILSGLIHRIDNSLDIYHIDTAQDINAFLENINAVTG